MWVLSHSTGQLVQIEDLFGMSISKLYLSQNGLKIEYLDRLVIILETLFQTSIRRACARMHTKKKKKKTTLFGIASKRAPFQTDVYLPEKWSYNTSEKGTPMFIFSFLFSNFGDHMHDLIFWVMDAFRSSNTTMMSNLNHWFIIDLEIFVKNR